jgi:PAS domain S-box-containing protein
MTSRAQQHHSEQQPEHGSLRTNLLKLAFLPLLVVFPAVLTVLVLVGGNQYDARVEAMVRGQITIARTYLDHQSIQIENFIRNQVQRENLHRLLADENASQQLDRLLVSLAAGTHLDFLIITTYDGTVIASSTGTPIGTLLPIQHLLKQAITGVLISGYEVLEPPHLAIISPQLAAKAIVGTNNTAPPSSTANGRGLMLSAAMPFPLSVEYPGAVLYGGILLNNDTSLIDRIRDMVFPLSPESEPLKGVVTLFLDDVSVVTSLELSNEHSAISTHASSEIAAEVLGQGRETVMSTRLFDISYLGCYAPIIAADGKRIGMIGSGIPQAPYQTEKWLLIGGITGLLMLAMLGIAIFFQRGTRRIVSRLENTVDAMKAVQEGKRDVRVEPDDERDEITALNIHFNELLDALQTGEEAQLQVQQAMADEAARRRALFEHERDGVVLLTEEGTILEANPSFSALLGYPQEELVALHIRDWDLSCSNSDDWNPACMESEPRGILETTYLRKDGSLFSAEVSTSMITWGERNYRRDAQDAEASDR